jgi:ABC-type multidrug transport system ATPase subunit
MTNLHIHQISKLYSKRRALHNIEIQLGAGVIALLGSNGAGKSTLLRIISTQMMPTSGHYTLNNLNSLTDLHDLRRQIGMLGHQSYLYPDLTLRENLMLFAQLYDIPDPCSRIDELANQFYIVERLHQPVVHLSHGLLKRAALIRAIMHNPTLLLLDEPFSGLDHESTQLLLDLIKQWRTSTRILILTTHNFQHASSCADQFVILHRGRIISHLTEQMSDQAIQQQYLTLIKSKSVL